MKILLRTRTACRGVLYTALFSLLYFLCSRRYICEEMISSICLKVSDLCKERAAGVICLPTDSAKQHPSIVNTPFPGKCQQGAASAVEAAVAFVVALEADHHSELEEGDVEVVEGALGVDTTLDHLLKC